jgi:DnaJ-class molecular chaperone
VSVAWFKACSVCREVHEIDCPNCRGRGLTRDPHGARTVWDLCGICGGSGRTACPACAADWSRGRPAPLPVGAEGWRAALPAAATG